MTGRHILVIKLGALGDFIQALGPMAAIRRHHADDRITLLTTKPFAGLAKKTGYFDDIMIDARPRWSRPDLWIAFRRDLLRGDFARVYDLQNNDRTAFYLRLFPRTRRPEWVGAAPGASHRNDSPQRTAGQAFDGHVQTLALAGIGDVRIDDLAWMDEDTAGLDLRAPYVLLVPGSAPDRPEKRWPAAHYAELARLLVRSGYRPVLIGTAAEAGVTSQIAKLCPEALDLTGQTSLGQIAALARHAAGAIGNDTGPMHIIAPAGSPSLILFSRHSNPARHAPKGPQVKALQVQELSALTPETVYESCAALLKSI